MNIEALAEAFHEDLDGKILSATLHSSVLELQLEYDDLLMPSRARSVTLKCIDPEEFEVTPGYLGSLGYFQEHPLLLDHSGPQAQLFFSSAPSSPADVFYLAHKVLEVEFAGWRKPASYLNGKPEAFWSHLAGGYGLLARGPHGPISALANAVDSLLEVNLVPSHHLNNPLSVLTLDRQFVICRSVEVVANDG
jgi:hypothetical protein